MNNTNEFQAPLYATIELAGALGTDKDIQQLTEGKDNINTVQNTDGQVAIALPYYSYLDNISSAATLAEEDLESTAGGFVIFNSFRNLDEAAEVFGDDVYLSMNEIIDRLNQNQRNNYNW